MIESKLVLVIPIVASFALYGFSDYTKDASKNKENETSEQVAPVQRA
ncbi:hypothetical protein [Viridibacillus arvi]